MEFGTVHCSHCKKELGYFPADNLPGEGLELYCSECKELLKEQEEKKGN